MRLCLSFAHCARALTLNERRFVANLFIMEKHDFHTNTVAKTGCVECVCLVRRVEQSGGVGAVKLYG